MKPGKVKAKNRLFNPDDTSNCLYLINSGVLEISTTMDNGLDFIMERCIRGTVVNAHSMIYEDECKVIGRASADEHLNFYVIDKMRFLSIVRKDHLMMIFLRKQVSNYLQLSKEC